MKKFLSKHAFWVVQVLGCSAFVLAMYFLGGIKGGTYEKFLFCIGIFLTYFIPSTILRYLYKGFVKTNPFKLIDCLKMLFFLMIIVILGKELPHYLGYILGRISEFLGIEKGELTSEIKAPKTSGIFAYVGPFIIFGGWTFFYFIIKEFRKYMASRMARLEIKDKIKQAQLNTLKGHLNPQFMISSLRTIKDLMQKDVSLSRKLLTQLSEILRYSLTKNNINSVSLNEELEIAENYVSLLNLEHDKKYQINFDLASNTLKNEVPPMLLTSLIEIATKYGILQLAEGGTAVLTSKQMPEELEIKLVHSGKIARSKETELIEKTIQQRLKLLFEGEAEFNTTHELNSTTLLVKMPISAL